MSEIRRICELHENELSLAIYGATCDVADLKESISQLGLLDPLVVTREGTVISGHRRLLALKELGWEEAPCVVVSPEDKNAEEILVIEYNRSRHKTMGQLRREGARLKDLIAKESSEKRLLNLNQNLLSNNNETSPDMLLNNKSGGSRKINARTEVAKQLGMSQAKWAQVEFINKYGKLGLAEIDEVIQQLDNDSIPVGVAYRQIKAHVKEIQAEKDAKARERAILSEPAKTVEREANEYNYVSARKIEELCHEISAILEVIERGCDAEFNPFPWISWEYSRSEAARQLQEIDAKIKRSFKHLSVISPEAIARSDAKFGPLPAK